MSRRIHDETAPMPAKGRLSPADMRILDDYIAAGAPRSSDSCAPRPGKDDGPAPLDCHPDVHIRPKVAWIMPKDRHDQYVCYGVDVTQASKRHAMAIAPIVQNRRIVHHALLMQSDRAEDPTPHPCTPGGVVRWRMIYAWAPGGQNLVLPEETGFPQEGTTHYVVQIHYNNVAGLEAETDASGFDVCTTDKLRPSDADVMAFGATNFTLPPRSRYDMTCKVTVPPFFGQVRAIYGMPHMHKLGTTLVNTLHPAGAGAKPVDLGTQSAWDFNNQPWYPIDATLRAGDVIKTRCAWINPTQSPVTFGENTEDEMCYAFTVYYPKITAPTWSWALPAASSTCTATPAASHERLGAIEP
ncbi:hypothetical protein [Pendulispora albinea]|uniref:Peptidylglycine alpha-amidating monooxygenase n=1 Tax=Pendulispora albinea TaxID=2741071 RepID=A0ABZ2M8D8_9BACT